MADSNTSSGPAPGVSAAPPKGPIAVKLTLLDGSIVDAPLDLRVHLAEPGNTDGAGNTSLVWQEFIVQQGQNKRFLVPAPAAIKVPGATQVPSAIKPVTFTPPLPLWCVWAPDDVSLSPQSPYSKVKGFGFPLLARFRGPNKDTLVLPNVITLNIIYFNLTDQPHNPTDSKDPIVANHTVAVNYYLDNLNIFLNFQQGQVPPGKRGEHHLFLRDGSPQSVDLQGNNPIVLPENFDDPSWGLPADLSNVIVVYWVNQIHRTGGTEGIALPFLQLAKIKINIGQTFQGPTCASIFMDFSRPSQLAHEIGHCLLYDPGLSKNTIEGPLNVKTKVLDWFDRLGVEGKNSRRSHGNKIYSRLPQIDGHQGHPAGNLMNKGGGATLQDWQTAVIRAAKQIGDGP